MVIMKCFCMLVRCTNISRLPNFLEQFDDDTLIFSGNYETLLQLCTFKGHRNLLIPYDKQGTSVYYKSYKSYLQYNLTEIHNNLNIQRNVRIYIETSKKNDLKELSHA